MGIPLFTQVFMITSHVFLLNPIHLWKDGPYFTSQCVTRLMKIRTIEIRFDVPISRFISYNGVRNGGCLMNKKKKQYEHDATIFGVCIILGIIGSNFIEYGIVSILLGIGIGAFVARRPIS